MEILTSQKLRGKLKIDCTITALSDEFADSIFKLASVRLLLVKRWNELTDSLLSTVQVLDKSGNEIDREIQDGDYFKVNTPAGQDWVRVDHVEHTKDDESNESLQLEVRRVDNPFQPDFVNDSLFNHSDADCDILVVSRKGMYITAAVYAKDEVPQQDQVISIGEKAIDKMKPILGGLRIQWRSLVNGLLGNLEEIETYSY